MTRGPVTVERDPYNAETPLSALAEPLTPPELFYVRNHFDIPDLDPDDWRLRVDGAVEAPLELSLDELRALTARTTAVTLECAGNGRRFMSGSTPGTPWGWGAAATAEFTGVPLREILRLARPTSDVREALFVGADRGPVADGRKTVAFERSLPLEEALEPGVLLAWAMAGRPLPAEHGFPLRVVVPRWYAMASVKWLVRIELLTESFHGWFQRERYVYRKELGTEAGTPVTRMRPRAIIARPGQGEALRAGRVQLSGSAWSGYGPVVRVQVSADGGARWNDAELEAPVSPGAARAWRFLWEAPPGSHELVVRATDAEGNVQPLAPLWNRLGYGNNVAHRVTVRVE